jgi:hypothetical protein
MRFTVIVNNMRANVTMLSYDGHDRTVNLLHSLESGSYETLMVDELYSKHKSTEVDRGVTAWIESPTELHSIALAGGRVLDIMLPHPLGFTLPLP